MRLFGLSLMAAGVLISGRAVESLADGGVASVRFAAIPRDDPTDFYEWELDQGGVVEVYESEETWLEWLPERRAPTVEVRYRRCLHASGLCEAWSERATYQFKADGDLNNDGVIGLADTREIGFGRPVTEFYLCAPAALPGPADTASRGP